MAALITSEITSEGVLVVTLNDSATRNAVGEGMTSRALWMRYSGEPVTGAEAYRIGLADWVTPDEELMETAVALAKRLARGPRDALGLVKQLVLKGYQQDFAEHLEDAARAFIATRQSSEHEEGVRAFLEKSEPNFR